MTPQLEALNGHQEQHGERQPNNDFADSSGMASCQMLPRCTDLPSPRRGRKTANVHLDYLNVLERSSSCTRTSLRAGQKRSIVAAQADPASNRAGKQFLRMYIPDSNNLLSRALVSKTPDFLLSHVTRLPESNGVLLKAGFLLSLCSNYCSILLN